MALQKTEASAEIKSLVQELDDIQENASLYFEYLQNRQAVLNNFLPKLNHQN